MRTWPPSTNGAWYSSLSSQQTFSGSHAGTVTAIVPPGRSTRASSAIAPPSSGMCSITSEAMTRSKAPLSNGRCTASPLTAPVQPSSATSPASAIAPNVARTSLSSASLMSQATTRATSTGRFERMPAEAAPEIEQAISRAHTELGVVDGEHQVVAPLRRAHLEELAVLLDRRLGGVRPAPPADHALAARRHQPWPGAQDRRGHDGSWPRARRHLRAGRRARSRRRCR